MKVYADFRQEVSINPIDVLEKLGIISGGDWLVEKGGKFIQMTEQSAGQHSYDREVGEVTREVYELYKAQQLLLTHFKDKRLKEELKQRRSLPAIEL